MYIISNKELKKLQDKNLELLIYFKKFCENHNIDFYLSGGSCLGAVRHNGFIPWDDDIDLLMKRDDYERLEILWNTYADTSRYSCVRPNDKIANGNKYITIHDNRTTFIQKGREMFDANQGIALEILPIDGYPNKKYQRSLQIFWALIYSLYANKLPYKKYGKIVEIICNTLLKLVSNRSTQYKIFRFAEKQMSKYKILDCEHLAVLCTFKNISHKYSKKMFDNPIYIQFEGVSMPIPREYDTYLRMLYGDYMKLPPLEERCHKHECVYLDLDTEYLKYKGIYYAQKE